MAIRARCADIRVLHGVKDASFRALKFRGTVGTQKNIDHVRCVNFQTFINQALIDCKQSHHEDM